MAEGSNIQVTVKVRPLIKREKDAKLPKLWRVKENFIQLVDATSSNDGFTFDHIFDEETTTREMFNTIAKPIVDATLKGFNGTIFAYGQTSSGKTHTMCGEDNQPGIMMMAVREIFNEIETMRDRQFLLRVGYIEIYNEKLYDLLDTTNVDLKIVEKTPRGEVTVTNKECIVSNETIIMELLQQGNKERKTAGTKMNERSSRSHTIFRIVIESSLSADQANEEERVVHTSYLNLVDLAGSERAVQTGATGSRLIEAGNINKSLLSLSLVISQLAEQSSHPDSFVNYRNSKLTRLLAASLGGNAMTAIICNVTPAALEETASTLNFAMSAKKVQNKPQVNEVCSDSVLMKRMMREIKRLNDELHETKNKSSMADLEKLKEKLFERESQILRAKPAKEAMRRRTWAPSLATTDETQPLVNAHVSRILPPGHRTHSLVPPKPPAPPLSPFGGESVSDTSLFMSTSQLNASIFDEPRTPLKFDRLRLMVSSARGSSTAPMSSAESLAIPAPAAPSSPTCLAVQLHTPREFRPNRYAASDQCRSPTTRVKDLESELDDLQSYTRLEKAVFSPATLSGRIELNSLMRNLADKEAELKLYRAEHEELLMYRAGLKHESDSEQSEDGTKLSAAEAEVDRLTAVLADHQQQLATCRAEHDTALLAVGQRMDELAAELAEANAAHQRELSAQMAALQASQDENTARVVQLTADLAAARDNAALAQSQFTSTDYEFEQFRTKSKRREQELVDRLEQQVGECAGLHSSVAGLQEKLLAQERIRSNESSVEAVRAELQAQNAVQLAALQTQLNEALADVRRAQEASDERNAQNAASLEQLQQSHLTAEQLWSEERKALEQQSAKLTERLSSEKSTLEAKFTALRDQHQQLQSEYEEVSQQLMDAVQDPQPDASVVAELTEMRADKERMRDAMAVLQTSLDNAQLEAMQQLSELRESLSRTEAAQTALQTSYADVCNKLVVLEPLRAINDILEAKISDYQQQIHQLKSGLVEGSTAAIHNGRAACAMAVALQHQHGLNVARTADQSVRLRAVIVAIAAHCLPSNTTTNDEVDGDGRTVPQLQAAIVDHFEQQLAEIHDLHQQLDDQQMQIERLEMQSDAQVFHLQQMLNETDDQLRKISELSEERETAIAAEAAELQELRKRCDALTELHREAEAEVARLEHTHHEVISERDENQKAFEKTIARNLDLEERGVVQAEQIKTMTETDREHRNDLDAARCTADRLKERLAEAETKYGERESELAASQLDAQKAAESLANLTEDLRSCELRYAAVQAELLASQDLCAGVQQQCDTLAAENQRLDSVVENNRAVFEQTELEMHEMREAMLGMPDFERLQEENVAMRAERDALMADATRIADERSQEIVELRAKIGAAEQKAMDQANVSEELRKQIAAQSGEDRATLAEEAAAATQTIEQLTQDIRELKSKIEESEQHAIDQANVNDELRKQMIVESKVERATIDSHLQEIHELKAKVAKAEQNLDELRQQMASESEAERATIENHLQEIHELKAKITTAEQNLDELHQQIVTANEAERATIESHLQEIQELQSKIATAEQNIIDQANVNEELRGQIAAQTKAYDLKLAAEADAAAQTIEQQLHEINALKTKIDSAEQSVDEQVKLNEDLRRQIDIQSKAESSTLSEKASAAAQKIEQQSEEIRELKVQIVAAEHNVTYQTTINDELRQQIADQTERIQQLLLDADKIGKLHTELDAAKQQTHDQGRECERLRSLLDDVQREAKQLQLHGEQQALEIAYLIPLRQKYEALKAEHESAMDTDTEPSAELTAAYESVADLSKQLQNRREHIEVLQQANDRMKNQLQTANDEHERLRNEHTAVVTKLRDQHLAQLAQHVEKLQRASEAHQATITELQQLRSRVRSEQSFNEKELKITELETHLQHLHNEDATRRQQNDALNTCNQHLTKELDDLRARLQLDRKSRRRSVHDDSRSTFTSPTAAPSSAYIFPATTTGAAKAVGVSMHTQTGDDEVSPCGCADMDQRIKLLQRDMKIKECIIARQKMEKESLTAENAHLKKLVFKVEQDHNNLVTRMAEQAKKHQLALKAASVCTKCTSTAAKTTATPTANSVQRVDRDQQTDDLPLYNGSALIAQQEQDKLQEELLTMSNKYKQAKWLCQKRKDAIEQLEQQLQAAAGAQRSSAKLGDRLLKENTLANSSQSNADYKQIALDVKRLEAENQELRNENHALQISAKMQTNSGTMEPPYQSNEEDRLKSIIDELEAENKVTRDKYDGLKRVLVARNREIQFLTLNREAKH